MFKTLVTLQNLSCFIKSNKKIDVRNIQRLLTLPMLKHLTSIFCLLFTNCGCFSPSIVFPCVICLVSVMICIFNCEEFSFTGRFRVVLVFAILTVAPLVSESLLGNTPLTMAILQKCMGTFSS